MGKSESAAAAGMRRKPSVLMVDQGTAVGEALVVLLATMGFPARHAPVHDLGTAVAQDVPDVLLVDGALPADQVGECVAAVRTQRPGARVVVLVSKRNDSVTARALHPSAQGWASYFDGPDALAKALSGEAPPPAARPGTARGRLDGPLAQLTEREMDVLQALVGGGSNGDIAALLGVSPNTVRTHVQNLFGKLDVHSRLEAVSVALNAGLRPSPVAEELAG